jgi:hypothetical protein
VHTNTTTSILGLAQLSTREDNTQFRNAGDIDSASSMQRATYMHISHNRKRGCGCAAHQASSVLYASTVANMLPLSCLAGHAASHHAVPCCAGRAPSFCAWYRTPCEPSARSARPAAFACDCVCAQCAVPVLVGVLLRLRSGRSWLIVSCFVFDRGILPCFDEPLAPSLRRRVQRRPVVPAST